MDGFDFDVGLNKPPAKPRRPKKQNSATSSPVDINISTNINKHDNQQDINIAASSARDLKQELTEKELKFIECHLIHRMNRQDAMIAAGYGGFHPRTRYYIASRIIHKYESRAQDRRNLFRELGAGEVAICRGLLGIAQDRRNPAMVRRAAWADLASCMGLKGEQIENFQGVTLNVYSQEEAKRLGITSGPPARDESQEPPHIQITK